MALGHSRQLEIIFYQVAQVIEALHAEVHKQYYKSLGKLGQIVLLDGAGFLGDKGLKLPLYS